MSKRYKKAPSKKKELETRDQFPELPEDIGDAIGKADEVSPAFKMLPDDQKALVAMTIHQRYGPIPSPQDMADYNDVIPNGADRIMSMAERTQRDQSRLLIGYINQGYLRIIGGFILIVLLMAGGLYLIANDYHIAGIVSFVGGFSALIGTYITGRVMSKQEGKKK